MQAQDEFSKAYKLQRLWDHFIISGWKSVFKCCILILKTYEDQLLKMNYENLLSTLSNLPI